MKPEAAFSGRPRRGRLRAADHSAPTPGEAFPVVFASPGCRALRDFPGRLRINKQRSCPNEDRLCICKMKVDTHKSVGVYFFVVEYKEKDVGLWAKKEHAIESIAKMRK